MSVGRVGLRISYKKKLYRIAIACDVWASWRVRRIIKVRNNYSLAPLARSHETCAKYRVNTATFINTPTHTQLSVYTYYWMVLSVSQQVCKLYVWIYFAPIQMPFGKSRCIMRARSCNWNITHFLDNGAHGQPKLSREELTIHKCV